MQTAPKVYLVFWGSQWANDPAGAHAALTGLFSNLYGTADSWGTILDQYCENLPVGTSTCGNSGTHIAHPTSSLLAGVLDDTSAPAPSGATTAQIAAEAAKAAASFGTPPGGVANAQYVVASPSGVRPSGFPNSYCGWHSSTSSAIGQISYTNLPYVPDLGAGACTTLSPAQPLDGYESTETHEYAESATDPFPSTGWLAKGGQEIGDLCVNLDATLTLAGSRYDVQGLWSNAAGACVSRG